MFGHQPSVSPRPLLGRWFQHAFNYFRRSRYETSINGSCSARPEHLQEWKELLLSIYFWLEINGCSRFLVGNWMLAVSKGGANDVEALEGMTQGSDGYGMYGPKLSAKNWWFNPKHARSLLRKRYVCSSYIHQACWKHLKTIEIYPDSLHPIRSKRLKAHCRLAVQAA